MAQGSAGNVIAALCSFFIPGLGQLVQGRPIAALIHFGIYVLLWVVTFGWLAWIMHIIPPLGAAWYRPPQPRT